MEQNKKFYLQCKYCGFKIKDFSEWFSYKQKCPECGSPEALVWYYRDIKELVDLIRKPAFTPDSLWGYFDFLPMLQPDNINSLGGEGVVPIDRWDFLEEFAKEKYNIHIKVYAHRHDRNHATGTFKDLAGTVVSSVLKENGVENFVGASTGNIGVAYSCYLAAADINLYLFIPKISIPSQESAISSFGQNVMRVEGDYAGAKKMAKEFAHKNDFVLTGGNFDPMRIEAKKTMVYEWMRLLPEFPTVFMQAISGGSGPIGVAKACEELKDTGSFERMPRMILPQPHRCSPMAAAWEKAKADDFPEGWENNYPVYENPETTIQTLSTGNPTAYPSLARLVRESKGEIISSTEEYAIDVTRLVAYKTTMRMGPAAAITVVGFFQSLREGTIRDGDVVMLNIGEGTARSPEYMQKVSYSAKNIQSLDDCTLQDRKVFLDKLWEAVDKI
jgi:threonine synthase